MKRRQLIQNKLRRKRVASADDLYKECKYIEAMFRLSDTVHCFPAHYAIIRYYLDLKENGAVYPSILKRVQDIVGRYGYTSQFWEEIRRTRRVREKTRNRVFFLLRAIQGKSNIKRGQKLYRHDQMRVTSFASAAKDFLARLNYAPLTDNQYNFLIRTEHILGIYWSDLSQGENGLAPRKEEETWRLDL